MREGLVSLVLSKDDAQTLLEWELVSERPSGPGQLKVVAGPVQTVSCPYKRGNEGGKVRLL